MISVCLAAYNGEKYIKEQLESILGQLQEQDELVVSDDGSTDATLDIIRDLGDERIKVVASNAHNLTLNFENALKHAKGDCIFLSDQDDVWLPNKVAVMLEELKEVDMVVSDAIVVDEAKERLLDSFFSVRNSRAGYWKNLAASTYLGCCMAFRKEVLTYALPFPTGIVMHDIWLGLCAELMGTTKFIKTPLMLYRRHGANVSSTTGGSSIPVIERIAYRAKLWNETQKRKRNSRKNTRL